MLMWSSIKAIIYNNKFYFSNFLSISYLGTKKGSVLGILNPSPRSPLSSLGLSTSIDRRTHCESSGSFLRQTGNNEAKQKKDIKI